MLPFEVGTLLAQEYDVGLEENAHSFLERIIDEQGLVVKLRLNTERLSESAAEVKAAIGAAFTDPNGIGDDLVYDLEKEAVDEIVPNNARIDEDAVLKSILRRVFEIASRAAIDRVDDDSPSRHGGKVGIDDLYLGFFEYPEIAALFGFDSSILKPIFSVPSEAVLNRPDRNSLSLESVQKMVPVNDFNGFPLPLGTGVDALWTLTTNIALYLNRDGQERDEQMRAIDNIPIKDTPGATLMQNTQLKLLGLLLYELHHLPESIRSESSDRKGKSYEGFTIDDLYRVVLGLARSVPHPEYNDPVVVPPSDLIRGWPHLRALVEAVSQGS